MALVAQWKFNDSGAIDEMGFNFWLDTSGNHNTFIGINGPTSASGFKDFPNTAIQLTAASQQSLVLESAQQTNLDLGTAFTIAMRVYFDSLPAEVDNKYVNLISRYGSTGWNLRIERPANNISIILDPTDFADETFTSLQINTWYSIIVVYNGIDVRFYLDNVLDNTPLAYTQNIADVTGDIWLGWNPNYQTANSVYFDGKFDDVAIYNHAFSDEERNLFFSLGDDFTSISPSSPFTLSQKSLLLFNDHKPTWRRL